VARPEAAGSQSLERGLAILSSFRSAQPLLGVSDLARALGLSRSTTHRYVATLATLGYLQQDVETKKYRLGPRVLDLGFSAINSMELRHIGTPHLEQLSVATRHTVNMAVLDGVDIVYIERIQGSGPQEIDLNLHVGSRLPAYCTSAGKVLLAFLPRDELRSRLDEMKLTRRGPNTITAKRELLKELDHVRERGVAVNNEELAYGLRSIAAPVRSQSGDVVAAVNLAMHRSLVSMDELFEDFAPALVQTADEIAAHIGFRQVTYGRR
jgi:IclR family transcriptional regulator, pca regulon regulatory protein